MDYIYWNSNINGTENKKKKTDPLEDLITSGEIKLSQQSFHSHLISYQR